MIADIKFDETPSNSKTWFIAEFIHRSLRKKKVRFIREIHFPTFRNTNQGRYLEI